ncbi:MAG: type I-D CRISPR-associated helicase Cas3' [Candidatus Anstonellales archaeon]
MMKVRERAAPIIKTKYGRLHPFQKELIEAILDPKIGLVKVEAPVGIGKTTAIRKALDYCDTPIIATFPTTILVNAQSANISSGTDSYYWPYDTKTTDRSYEIFITEYSSQSLLYLAMKNYHEIKGLSRGDILSRLFSQAPFIGGKSIILTTPDVLWLLYSGKYRRSRRLQEHLSNAVVIFDEFHCYANLANFYKLLNRLGEGRVSKVILMSATPFMRDDIVVEFPGDHLQISFSESGIYGEEMRVFNHELDMEIIEENYRDTSNLINILKGTLKQLPRPAAVIFDSIFRLMQVELLLKEEFPGLRFHRYDGMVKERVNLSYDSVLLGTSSVEVGVNMDFLSLIFEGSNWTSAIQRLGRVGRLRPGKALLISDRNFRPYRPRGRDIARDELEGILREYLPDPRNDWTSGELFRGDMPNFLLVDSYGTCYIYGPGIFSMFEVLEYEQQMPEDTESLVKLLRDFGVEDNKIEEIKMRVTLFPVAGIVRGKGFRSRYERIVSVDERKDEWVIRLANGEYFYFYRGENDD